MKRYAIFMAILLASLQLEQITPAAVITFYIIFVAFNYKDMKKDFIIED